MATKVVMNAAGLRELRTSPAMAGLMSRVADAVAANGEQLAGTAEVQAGAGSVRVPIEMRRTTQAGVGLNDPLPHRARSAVLVSHPTPTGRERGMRALLSALDAGASL